jgi:gamma-glutamylcyclotransferase (GGCT)/AIG2-like uncharacterized protein YtfP
VLYFAYGMNTNNNQMSPKAVRLGPAVLPNYAWEMLLYANVYEQPGGCSLGILWDIDDEILAGLDQREGFPVFYNRVYTDVFHEGETKQAWVYTMTADNRSHLQGTTPSKTYLDSVTEGFATDGLSVANLKEHNNFM